MTAQAGATAVPDHDDPAVHRPEETELAAPPAGRKTLRSTVELVLTEWSSTLRAGLLLFGLVVASGVAIAVAARWAPALAGPVAGLAALVAAVVTSKLPLKDNAAR